jgi:hypothetical protein
MDESHANVRAQRPSRRGRLTAAALVAGGLPAGVVLAGTQIAGAATGSSGSSGSNSTAAVSSSARPDPATMKHGPGERLLTGSTASKVRAAALAAVRGGTIIRVETDSEGSPYEAHVRKADGSIVTVKVDASFQVRGTETGFGAGAPRQSNGSSA